MHRFFSTKTSDDERIRKGRKKEKRKNIENQFLERLSIFYLTCTYPRAESTLYNHVPDTSRQSNETTGVPSQTKSHVPWTIKLRSARNPIQHWPARKNKRKSVNKKKRKRRTKERREERPLVDRWNNERRTEKRG